MHSVLQFDEIAGNRIHLYNIAIETFLGNPGETGHHLNTGSQIILARLVLMRHNRRSGRDMGHPVSNHLCDYASY